MQIEVQCSKSFFKNFLSQEAEAFGNNVERQKLRPKLKKCMYYIIYREYLPCLQSSASGSFL